MNTIISCVVAVCVTALALNGNIGGDAAVAVLAALPVAHAGAAKLLA